MAYPGQVLTVITNGAPIAYVIAGGTPYASGDTIPEGKAEGDENPSTRTLVRLGTKQEIDEASMSAIINWIESEEPEP